MNKVYKGKITFNKDGESTLIKWYLCKFPNEIEEYPYIFNNF
jgi:hypothetical protein